VGFHAAKGSKEMETLSEGNKLESIFPVARTRKLLSAYATFSAAFWLWFVWPWLFNQQVMSKVGFEPVLAPVFFVALVALLALAAMLILKGHVLAPLACYAILLFHVCAMAMQWILQGNQPALIAVSRFAVWSWISATVYRLNQS
jgi:hypothetical protein